MKKIFNKIIFLAFLVIIILILLIFREPSSQMPFLKDFSIENTEEKIVYGFNAKEISAQRSNQIINILQLEADLKTIRLFLDEKKFYVESLYNPLPSPYPDVITREIVCPHEYLPIIEEDDNENFYKIVYILYANDRFSYGACTPDSVVYKAIFSLIHCKNTNKLYQIKFFSPLESYDEEILNKIRNFSC